MTARSRKWWTSLELGRMIELRRAGAKRSEIAAMLGRSEASVKAQIGRFVRFVPPVVKHCRACGRKLPR
jgi:hypothetical protein